MSPQTVQKHSHLRVSLKIELPRERSDPQARIAKLENELHWAHLKIQVLEERLRQRRIQMFGPPSETLSNLQLELLAEDEPSVTAEEIEAEAKREPVITRPPRRAQAASGPRAIAGEPAAR